jgi:uncharacterized protein
VGKLLLIVVAVLLVFFIVKSYQRSLHGRPSPPAARTKGGEDMVRCARCGVHLPRSEGIMSGGEFFCSEEHRRGAR